MVNAIERFLKSQILKLEQIRKNIDFHIVSTTEAMENIQKAIDCLRATTEAEGFIWDEVIASIEKKKARYRQAIEEKIEIIEENLMEENQEINTALQEIKAILKEN